MSISEVYLIDCMEYMASCKDKQFDLAIVDVPYGINEDGRKNHTRSCKAKSKDYSSNSKYDSNSPSKEYFNELMRVSKNQIIWGANHFISKIPFDSPCWLVWDKDNGDTDFADCELAWTSFKTATRKFRYKWQGMLQENMKDKEILIHPNHKPIALYKFALKNYAKKGDIIFDSHLGGGSHRIACYDGGFDFYGCENDKLYYNEQEKRFENYKLQLKLF